MNYQNINNNNNYNNYNKNQQSNNININNGESYYSKMVRIMFNECMKHKIHNLLENKSNVDAVNYLINDYQLMDDIIIELDKCNPEKLFQGNKFCYNFWKNSTYEKQLQVMYNSLVNKIIEYFNKNNPQNQNNGVFNSLCFKFICENFNAKSNYYAKNYNLNATENLSLQIINCVFFYSFTRILLEGKIINKMMNLQQHLLNAETDMAKLFLGNKNIHDECNKLCNNTTEIGKKFMDVFRQPNEFIGNPSSVIFLKNRVTSIIAQQKNNNNQNFFNNQQMMNMNRNFNVARQVNPNFQPTNSKTNRELEIQIREIANRIIANKYHIELQIGENDTFKFRKYLEECLELLKYFEKHPEYNLNNNKIGIIKSHITKLNMNYEDQLGKIKKNVLYRELKQEMIKIYVSLTYLKESDDLQVRRNIINQLIGNSMCIKNFQKPFEHFPEDTKKLIFNSYTLDVMKLRSKLINM